MKKLFPIALLLCTVFSLSSFAPVHPSATVNKVTKPVLAISWPIAGAIESAPVYTYEINGSGSTPYSVTLKKNGNLIGTYPITGGGSSYPMVYYSQGDMSTPTNGDVSGFQLVFFGPDSYNLTIYSI